MADNNDQQTSTLDCNKMSYTTISGNQIETLNLNFYDAPVNTGDMKIDYCPAPVSTFMGRRDELTELKTLLTKHQIIALIGMGGLGKTQLTRQYASENKAAYRYRYWLESETRERLVRSFKNLAKKLHIESDNEHEIVNDVYKMFENGRALLVFDNVERSEHVYEYLPTRVDLSSEIIVHVLITSRWTDWTCDELIASYPLPSLKVPDSLELLQRKFGKTNIEVMKYEWENLVNLLGNLPLAIQVAASYLQKRTKHIPDLRMVLANYIEQLNQGADRLLNDKSAEYDNRSIYTSVLLTLEQLERMTDDASKLAVTLINTAAYLNPDLIFKNYFLKLLDNNDNAYILDDALVILTDFSLFHQYVVSFRGGGIYYNVHRVIQTSMRHNQTVKKTSDVYYTEALKYTVNDEIFLDSYVLQYADRRVSAVANYCNLYPSSRLLPNLVHDHFPVVEVVFEIMHIDQIHLMIKQHDFVHWAMHCDHLPMVQLLYRCSVRNNQLFSENGETLLHNACEYGRTNIAKWLLENGASPSAPDKAGCTPLHRAAERAQYEIAELILNTDKTSVNVKNNDGNSPLYCIRYFCNSTSAILSTIRVLIENGADISEVNARNGKILHYAIDSADHELVSLILQRNKELINIRDECGQTAVHIIPYNGLNSNHEEIDDKNILLTIRVLLEYGADILDVKLLHFAAKCLDSELISLLLQKNKELVNKTDCFGQTALHVINYSNTDVDNERILSIIRVLNEYGADITKTDKRGRTVLHSAAIGACAAAVLLILELQKDLINTVDEDGQTALHVIPYASVFMHNGRILTTIRALVDNGGDITKPDLRGNTVLHLAARAGHVAAVSLILQMSTELINAVDENGQTALHVVHGKSVLFATDFSFKTIARELMKNGLSLDSRDKTGRTPLDTVQPQFKKLLLQVAEECKEQSLVQPANYK